jgi:hypothetical protein
MRRCLLLYAGITAALLIAAPDCGYAQAVSPMSTADFERTLLQTRQLKMTTTLSKQSDGRVALRTQDGIIELDTKLIDITRFVNLPAEVKVEQLNDFPATVTEVKPRPSPTWEMLSLQERRAFPEVDAAQNRLKLAMGRTLIRGSGSAEFSTAQNAAGELERKIKDSYASLDAASRRLRGRTLVDQHAEVRRLQRDFFRKDYNERYAPETYQRIYANTRGASALRLKGEDLPLCSGVLIAKHLVLTNRHCVTHADATQMEVVFDYEEDLQGKRMNQRSFPVSHIRFRGGEPFLDFAILEVARDTNGAIPGEIYPPQCLSMSPPKHMEAIYVVGFPLGQPRVVHDNAHVYFPFQVDSNEYVRIEISVREELKSGPEEDQSYIDGKLREFIDSYKPRMENGAIVYEYYSERFGDQPTIGVDSDTYAGNSGSPAFHRRTHALVGLLFDGHRTSDEPWAPGWRTHEAILPVLKIIEAMNAQEPGWFASQEICMR